MNPQIADYEDALQYEIVALRNRIEMIEPEDIRLARIAEVI